MSADTEVSTTGASEATAAGARRVAVGVGLLAFLLRLPALTRPSTLVFDELFYATDAADLLRWGSEHGQPAHPELGKWLIASGIATFGFDPLGWRIASVVAGALLCGVVAWTAIRLTGRTAAGWTGGALVALDGLVHVTSRLALLDVFVALFTTATVAALVGAWTAQPDARAARRWWWAAAVALGLGTSVKWSALAFAPLVLGVAWVLAGRLAAPGRPRHRARVGAVVAVLALPVLLVVATTLPRELGPDRVTPAAWAHEQVGVARFHRDLRPTSGNVASAWTWAFQTHPVDLYRARCPLAEGTGQICADRRATVARIVAGGNPVVWLLGLAGVAALLVGCARGREEAALLAGGVAAAWLPWLLSPRKTLSFYAVVVTPMLVLAVVWALDRVPGRWRRWAERSAVVLAALAFVVLWSVWSAQPVSPRVHRWMTWWPGWA